LYRVFFSCDTYRITLLIAARLCVLSLTAVTIATRSAPIFQVVKGIENSSEILPDFCKLRAFDLAHVAKGGSVTDNYTISKLAIFTEVAASKLYIAIL
jgi:hypothetical protein